MQSLLAYGKHEFSFYVAGLLTLTGAATGRLVCGWLCPFGLVQELLGKLSNRKIGIPRVFILMKYPILILTLLLPVLWLDPAGVASPYFCKYLCPAGTLEGGLPLGLGRPELRSLLGGLFSWKVGVMVFFLVGSVFVSRPFCRTMCPLGTFYGLFNSISLWRIELDSNRCISCGNCQIVCPVDIHVTHSLNDPECIRCLKCINECPADALSFSTLPSKQGFKIPPIE
jgi:polyferredoxin